MPTYPVEAYPADAAIDALAGTTDQETGLEYIPTGTNKASSPSLQTKRNRKWARIKKILSVEEQGRFKSENNALLFGVNPIDYTLGGTQKSFTGAANQSLTNNATNYVYIDASNALQVSTVSFPADKTTFFPICEAVVSSGVLGTVTDRRGWGRNITPQATTTSTTGLAGTSWTIDDDNSGSGVACQLRANRGTDNAEDAALEWDEANDRWNVRAQHSTLTYANINALALLISGTSMVDSNGAAKVQSAVAGDGLDHSAGVLSVQTASASGTSIGGSGEVAVDPSDGIAIDANGVRVSLTSNGGLLLSGSAGSMTLGVKTDGSTTSLDGSGNVIVKDNGLSGAKFANQSTSSGTSGTGSIIFEATLANGNTVTIHNANAPFKYKVIGAKSVAKSADGGTWKVDNGTNDIIPAVTITGTDRKVNYADLIDDAYHEVALSGTLRVVGDGSLADVTVYIEVVRVA